ncbi:1045_t:CDS:10, partial [Scutellospora calospora]
CHNLKTNWKYPPAAIIYELKTYGDGTILVHLVSSENSSAVTNLNCIRPILYFRIFRPNGKINSINLNVTGIIPDFNFCKTKVGRTYKNYLKVYPLITENILVTYVNSTDVFSASVYGLLISWKGEIISSTFLRKAPVKNKSVSPPGTLYFPRNRNLIGFVYAALQPDTGDIDWGLFTMPIPTNNRQINLTREGVIKNDGGSMINFVAFPTAAGDYCLVVARSYDVSNTSSPQFDITLQSHLKVDAHFIYTTETGNTIPSMLYSSSIENLNVFAIACSADYSGLGNMCHLYFANDNSTMAYPFTLNIVFLSIGSVDRAVSNELGLNIRTTDYLSLDPLYYQGFLLTVHRPQQTGQIIYGYMINATGQFVSNWTLPQPFKTNSTEDVYGILPNNSIAYALQTDASNWTIDYKKLPMMTMLGDNGYFNPQINSTFPSIDDTVPLRTNKISINYKQAVTLSDGNISVFQLQDIYGDNLLRQTYSGTSGYCNLTTDSLTITCYILESTFNLPNAVYYVLVDPDFVRLNSSNEPLLGIEKLVWAFKSSQAIIEPYSAIIKSIIRLDVAGTASFENLTSEGKKEFINQINHELATCVPVKVTRFHNEHDYQYDPQSFEKRILLPLTIFGNSNIIENSSIIKNSSIIEENSLHVFWDLDVLIKNSNLTLISRMKNTKLLDSRFGIIRAHHFTESLFY